MILSIGLDVAKLKLDFFSDNIHCVIKNEKKSIIKHFKGIDRSRPIVMEATGKYHRIAHRTLEGMGFAVMVVNPYQTHNFAKAHKLRCKTDKKDAEILSKFAEKMDFIKTPCMSEQQEEMQDLMRHLDDLKKIKNDIRQRLETSRARIRKSLKAVNKTLEAEIAVMEANLVKEVESNEKTKKHFELLQTIPGIGVTTALALLCILRELGQVDKRAIAALCGLAPMNDDSGERCGKRRIQGGRHDVRRHLYIPIVGAATRHNSRLKEFYQRLIAAGKPGKVALTACMRKLVVWANAIIKTEIGWEENRGCNLARELS